MPDEYNYDIDLVETAESNETLIAKKNIRVIDCSIPTDPDLCSLWNFNHCPTDKNYFNPFELGDKVYFQQPNFATVGPPATYDVINMATGQPIVSQGTDPLVTTQQVTATDYRPYINVVVSTTQLTNVSCWYLRVGTEDNYTYSEPYKKVVCENTILLEGYYPGYDCRGHWYGSGSIYKAQIRIQGEVSPTQLDVEEDIYEHSGQRKSTTSSEVFVLMSKRVPYYVVKKIHDIFASKRVTIDGLEYQRTISLPKGLTKGMMWAINTNIIRKCPKINFNCE